MLVFTCDSSEGWKVWCQISAFTSDSCKGWKVWCPIWVLTHDSSEGWKVWCPIWVLTCDSCEGRFVLRGQQVNGRVVQHIGSGRLKHCYTSIISSEKKERSSGTIICMGKIAASVLLKLFINSNERCQNTDTSVLFSVLNIFYGDNKGQHESAGFFY